MKRHVWFERGNSNVYPNTYTVLVGRPGVGKGQAIIPAISALDSAGTANMLSDRLTMPFILEKLSKGFPSTVQGTAGGITIGTDSTALVVSDEMEVFVSTGDDVIINMTALWDSREHPFGYGTRGKGEWNIDKPGVSYLAGTTPRSLVRSVPVAAIGGGFTRRVNFVFSNEAHKDKPFASRNGSNLRDSLVDDLRYISTNLRGNYKLDPCVEGSFEQYYKGCLIGELEDEATATYKDSAWVHALKLAMVVQAATNDDHVIGKAAWDIATQEINQVVADISIVFRGVGLSDMTVAADRLMSYLEIAGNATRKQIGQMMWQYAMGPDIDVILATLEQAGLITSYSSGKNQVYKMVPKPTPKGAGVP